MGRDGGSCQHPRSQSVSDYTRTRRQQLLREAEGYLDLITVFADQWSLSTERRDCLARRAIETLTRLDPNCGQRAHSLYLTGQAYRIMERFQEAIAPLKESSDLDAENIHVWLALGWCYKRTGRMDLAIQALEEALVAGPEEAIIRYNLACYWSLAENVKLAVMYLSQAFELDPNYRDLVGSEADFEPIRRHPHFQALTSVIV